jgi:hypothetical protein
VAADDAGLELSRSRRVSRLVQPHSQPKVSAAPAVNGGTFVFGGSHTITVLRPRAQLDLQRLIGAYPEPG